MKIMINADGLAAMTKLVITGVEAERKLGSGSSHVSGELECIKRLRRITGLGHQEAKDLVQAAQPDRDPVLRIARQICAEEDGAPSRLKARHPFALALERK